MSTMALRPRFFGAVRGEAIKVTRQLSFWLMILAGFVLLGVVTLAVTSTQDSQAQLAADPTAWAYGKLEVFGTMFQIGSGIFLLIVGSRLLAMEYSSGTIRVLCARGIGRLHLLLAKLASLVVIAVAIFAGYLIVVGLILALPVGSLSGGLSPVQHISSEFWADLGRWALVQGMSMGVAILMAAAAAAIGRSLAFAMAAALAFFPADNFVVILELLGARSTHHDHPWLDVSQYQLGPNLNVILNLIEPSHQARAAFAVPLQPVDATHALVVIVVFAAAFALMAVIRTVQPDVLE